MLLLLYQVLSAEVLMLLTGTAEKVAVPDRVHCLIGRSRDRR